MHVFQALSLHGKEYEKRAIRVTHCRAQVSESFLSSGHPLA